MYGRMIDVADVLMIAAGVCAVMGFGLSYFAELFH